MFKGKLTYTLAGIAVAYGLFGLLAGLIDNQTAVSIIWYGLTAFGLRRAIN